MLRISIAFGEIFHYKSFFQFSSVQSYFVLWPHKIHRELQKMVLLVAKFEIYRNIKPVVLMIIIIIMMMIIMITKIILTIIITITIIITVKKLFIPNLAEKS